MCVFTEGDEEGTTALHTAQLSKLRQREKELEEQLYKLTVDLDQTHAADRQKAQHLQALKEEQEKASKLNKKVRLYRRHKKIICYLVFSSWVNLFVIMYG